MKILFDCRYVRTDHHDGISRFSARLVEELSLLVNQTGEHTVTMLISDSAQLKLLPDLPWELISAPTSVRELRVARQVNRLHPDIVFSPMQTMGSGGRQYPLVLTVHDLIYYRHPKPPTALAWACAPRLAPIPSCLVAPANPAQWGRRHRRRFRHNRAPHRQPSPHP